jgi:isocitrate dehydrogenase (NAD+)
MGTNRANPTAMVLSATMMLRHLGYVSLSMQSLYDLLRQLLSSPSLDNLANSIASATFGVINEGSVRTADMGGKCANTCTRYSETSHYLQVQQLPTISLRPSLRNSGHN